MPDRQTAPKAEPDPFAALERLEGSISRFEATLRAKIAALEETRDELLEALKEARQWIGFPLRDKQDQALAIAAVEKANDAIAKAEGRS